MIDVHILGIKKVIRDGKSLIQETKPNGSQAGFEIRKTR